MNFIIDKWLDEFVLKIKNEYGNRVVFIGLQGSYKRKEANESSDIDVVVILDNLTIKDLKKYRDIISHMPYSEKACGFISGKNELLNWEKSELFQFYYDTQPIFGNIDYLLPMIDKADIKRAVKIGACNIYHASCHNFLYERNYDILSGLYKSAFFVLQAKYFDETNKYLVSKSELIKFLDGVDKEILNICIDRKKLSEVNEDDFLVYSDKIICWSSNIVKSY
ncbi:nucleotidyltransferase domain-containing protein [Anaerovorax odorimutans]|uniref:nucleotidyltransferase domain-containing protein n=1 Tax=Anaerovorax odorimutans TaxID=109327 RepID=UPI000405B755|nr:nucleotidyltransferase domain-containing protein [Anaerovorax odorimutans]